MSSHPRPIAVVEPVSSFLPSLGRFLDKAAYPWMTVSSDEAPVRDVGTLIIGGGRFSVGELDRFPHLRLIVRAGIGLDLIDLEAAGRRGVAVVNTPGYATEEVADHAILLLLAAARRLHYFERQAGCDWLSVDCSGVRRLAGATLGLIGFGAIGRAVARRARALGMSILAYDPYVSTEFICSLGTAPSRLDDLLADSDAISLHAPLTPETHHVLDRSTFRLMSRRPVIVNTARGAMINLSELVSALDAGLVSSAALDVVDGEPYPPSALLDRDDVIITPHVAWYSDGARDEMGRRAAEIALLHARTGMIESPLNHVMDPR